MDIDETIKDCVTQLICDYPHLTRDRAQQLIRESADGIWIRWSVTPPTSDEAPIIGLDCLGYIHLATHLIGSDGQWAECWRPITGL